MQNIAIIIIALLENAKHFDKDPGKLWIRVPSETNMRKTCLKLAKRDPDSLSTETRLYLCEDHFDGEGLEEEEDELKIEPEVGPSLMSPLSEDARVEGVPAWTTRASSSLMQDRALAVIRSNVWPGAVAYSNVGKKTECLYIGWGLKLQQPNFTPLQLPKPQDEYPLGPEVMEMADPTFAEEEAYHIAHLPPPPPPDMPGEGEGLGEEEEDEEDDEEEEE